MSGIPVGSMVDCRQCGRFELTGTAEAVLASVDPRLKMKIGFWTRDQNELGDQPIVTDYKIEEVKALPELTVMERAERLLRFAIREQRDLGGFIKFPSAEAVGITHSRSDPDVIALGRLLRERGWFSDNISAGSAQVSPNGFIHASETNATESVSGFIAMWFDPSMNTARSDGLEPALRAAGYTPIVVSGVEHINKIDDEIISQIRRSRFLVADFTGHRGGVYFEAGFAMGLGRPVFWTCRKDDLKNLHFDIRQYNCIDWTDPVDLATRLKRRIEAVIGAGPIRT
jgi:nucleoside 2-deoxyribosyltransferase